MKTVFKKMLSLVLVAMLLVSAVPFQASATLIEPIGPSVEGTDETTAPTEDKTVEAEPVAENTNDTMSITVQVMDKNSDSTLETLGPVEILVSDYETMKNSSSYEDAVALLDELDSKYANITKADFVRMACFTNQILIVIQSVPGDDGQPTPPPVEGNTDVFKLTVVVGGSYTLDVYEGQFYANILKGREPARPGQHFLGWKSEKLGRAINDNDQITGNDTVTALWSNAIAYNLTLDENRKGEESVNYGVRLPYGARVIDYIAEFMPGGSKAPTRKGYAFLGWKLNGTYIDENTIWEYQGDATAYAQWKLADDRGDPIGGNTDVANGEVYLEIYKNGNTKGLVKRVKVTKYVEHDHISLSDAKKVAKKYVSAKSGYSLEFDGLFNEESWWWYCKDEETNGEKFVTVNLDGDEYVYLMVKNVKSSSNADSSNPKTGDSIYMAVTVMAMSASALAAAYIFTKKRAIK